MSIQHIGFDNGPQGLERPRERLDRLASHANAGARVENETDDSVGRAGIAKSATEFNRLSAKADRAHAVASSIRTMDQTMESVGATVDAMKAELEGVVKTYPPYPSESQERAMRLKSYAGLRTMIDRLTVPPNQGMQQRQKELDALLRDDYVTIIDSNGMTKTVLKEDLEIGPSGIYIPELTLSQASDDAAIQQAISQLDQARMVIQTRRENLHALAVSVGRTETYLPMDDRSAEQMSMHLGQDLAAQPVGIAHESTAQLEQLLG
jgi:flagellin-like hook-associated protein FlgL